MAVLVGKEAPNFKATCVTPSGEFEEMTLEQFRGQEVLLYFYPLDFTFVCPSEIIAFDNALPRFKERGVALVGVSVDSHFTHLAWRNTARDDGGIGEIGYPLVSDLNKNIARDYDVLTGDGGVAFRGLFLIDKKGVVRHQIVNDLPLGRNVDEAVRMVDALQFHESHGEVCPAGWNKGEAGMQPTKEGVANYLATHADKL